MHNFYQYIYLFYMRLCIYRWLHKNCGVYCIPTEKCETLTKFHIVCTSMGISF